MQAKSLLTYGLVLTAAYQLASLSWSVYQAPVITPMPSPVFSDPTAGPALDLAQLLNANLFGSSQPTPKPAPVITQAVKSRLAVKLLGIVRGSDEQRSVAILAERNQQRAYTVGETLRSSAGARLIAIEADRVVLEINGRNEYIELEASQRAARQPSRAVAAVTPSLPDRISLAEPEITALIGDYRRKLVTDPLSFGRFIQLSPVSKEGRISGYQLRPGRDARLFHQLGLRPGDIVTHVEDLDVTEPANVPKLLALISSDTPRLRLSLQRGDSQQDIDVEL